MLFAFLFSGIFQLLAIAAHGQQPARLWHGIEREIRYHPDGQDFVIQNGKRRFNRALYGTNTAFRVEAGDLPEFALYLPGMGGNLKFGLVSGDKSKWLINAASIEARYRPGTMIYKIKDELLGGGVLNIQVLAGADDENIIVKATLLNTSKPVKLLWAFGGATGKKISRDGDIGADPESSFYLQPDYCKGNVYTTGEQQFTLNFSGKALSETGRYEIDHTGTAAKTESVTKNVVYGIYPASTQIHIADANAQESPLQLFNSKGGELPVITGVTEAIAGKDLYWAIQNGKSLNSANPAQLFTKSEQNRQKLASRVTVKTPDPYINTLGGALSIAADGIWESPSYMHGAVAWRMRLPAWRGPYVADPLGWHDRAWSHFSSYALSQITEPLTGPVVADTALHLARQKEELGTSMFSSGYISRNPGGKIVPHHYDMNLVYIDELLNHFKWTGNLEEVKKLWPTIKRSLAWEKRNYDADGDGLYDAYCAIWASDALQYSGGGVTHSSAYNYRANRDAAYLAKLVGEDPKPYEQEAAHILNAINKQLWISSTGSYAEYKDLLGEKLLHPSAGLWTVYHAIDSQVPDAFQTYQALRYVDTRIPHIPVIAKGLTGDNHLLSTTNWEPYDWSLNNVVMAENLHTALAYWQGNRAEDAYQLWRSAIIESMYLGASPGNFQQISFYDAVRGELYRDFGDPIGMAARSLVEGLFGIRPDLLHNTVVIKPGFPAGWDHASLEIPDVRFDFKRSGNIDAYSIIPAFQKQADLQFEIPARFDRITAITINGKVVKWTVAGEAVGQPILKIYAGRLNKYNIKVIWRGTKIKPSNEPKAGAKVFDPQNVYHQTNIVNGSHTYFYQHKQGLFTWWQPVNKTITDTVKHLATQVWVAKGFKSELIDLKPYFNDKVTNIFKNQYLSPRPKSPTLQLPTQGIGNWAYPLVTANIDDSGLKKAVINGVFTIPQGIPFATSAGNEKNILFTSQWDNFPKQVTVPLSGKAAHAYFLMAGSTNPMQSRMVNGTITVTYTDGAKSILELKNPENWWPIEQDCMNDGFAFNTNAPKPLRVHLKTGEVTADVKKYSSIKGFSNTAIDGGAATVLDLPLDKTKELKSLTLATHTNDVVIGLMAITLIRE
ncbi:DUF4450 domain-containing protein [Mucilaginibacter boryungensis]|uniref:DUF4450 domain-containing protein n=2 Tax=Mucilaginibacter boryungensis TaxID=768480 RepID=A0ABR9XGM4_9SPHI|nr:DUF4450 domain-containing protein [Mucilaginibacter boryungensis]